MNDTRQSKTVKMLISAKFCFLYKAIYINSLPELILHGIQIAYTCHGAVEILKPSLETNPNDRSSGDRKLPVQNHWNSLRILEAHGRYGSRASL
jgi:hypothetical protein